MRKTLAAYLGIDPDNTGHHEKLISGVGGLLGIAAVMLVSQWASPADALPYVVASMGASAVLWFAAPLGKFSQPWNLLGGHGFSAVIGVTCALWIAPITLAAALAVGISITAMYYLRCIHPPGGATALMAVIGGESIHALGYGYVWMPVGVNVLVILVMAIAFNYLFDWRRYPAHVHRLLHASEAQEETVVGSQDLQYALRRIGSYVDVTEEELETIYRLAEHHARGDHLPVELIRLGHYYSNGKYGTEWSVRQVVDEGAAQDENALVIYKTVAGQGRRSTGTCTRIEFARWTKHEVYLNENSWQRVEG